MGIASMVIGTVALIIGFLPICGTWAIAPAIVGLLLGIVDTAIKSQHKQPKGMSIAGIVLNTLTIIIVITWWFVIFAAAAPDNMGIANMWQQGAGQLPQQSSMQPIQSAPPIQPMQPVQPIQSAPPMQPMQPVQPDPSSPTQ